MATLTITPNDLSQAAIDHREELLITPVVAANSVLKHMTARPGVGGREVVGELSGSIALKPYGSAGVVDTNGVTITGRTLETFLGAAVKRFDPNLAAKTVYGSLVTQGQEMVQEELPLRVCQYLATRLGEDLVKNIFCGRIRDLSHALGGTFYKGFDTIIEEAAPSSLKPTDQAPELTQANAFDTILKFYEDAHPALQSVPTKMFMPTWVYNLYRRDYLQTFGAAPYNQSFDKITLEGSNGLCEIVPVPYIGKFEKKVEQGEETVVPDVDSPYVNTYPLYLTTQANMLYGYGDGLAEEKIAIEKHDEFLLSFVATMYFGVQFASVSPNAISVMNVKK